MVEYEELPNAIESKKFKGYNYDPVTRIGEGGQTYGVFLALKQRIADEEPVELVVLKYIADTYLNDKKHGKQRRISLQREIDNLNAMEQIA